MGLNPSWDGWEPDVLLDQNISTWIFHDEQQSEPLVPVGARADIKSRDEMGWSSIEARVYVEGGVSSSVYSILSVPPDS